jgi:putative transposase
VDSTVYHETSRNGRGAHSKHAPSKEPPTPDTLAQEAKILAFVAAGREILVWAWVVMTRHPKCQNLNVRGRLYVNQERFSEGKIVGILREAEKGEKPIADFCREHGIAEQTFYRWRRKYGGMDTTDVQRLKELTSKNARLKWLLAERDLEVDALKELLAKNGKHGAAPSGRRLLEGARAVGAA